MIIIRDEHSYNDPKSLVFMKELGWRARRQSGDQRAASFLLQILSVAAQWGNTVSILGGPRGSLGDDLRSFVFFYSH